MSKPRSETTGLVPRLSEGGPVLLGESRHQVWHRDPEGDVEFAWFHLPTPVKVEHVQKAAVQCWNQWYEWYTAPQTQGIYRDGHLKGFGQDKVPTSKPRIRGPFIVPEYDELDMATYVIECRWKRRTPLIVSLEGAEELALTEYPDDYSEFFSNLSALSADPSLEREARRNARDIPAIAKREEEFRGHSRLMA